MEHLGYVCNPSSLNRERDTALKSVPYLESASFDILEIWLNSSRNADIAYICNIHIVCVMGGAKRYLANEIGVMV